MMFDDNTMHRRRWVIFFVLALIYILVYFYRVSLAVVADEISRELRLTPQQLGSLSSILFYVYAAAQLPLGPMIDRLGGRLVISCCGVLTAVGGVLFSQAGQMTTAMGGRALIGLGTSSVLMATFAIFSRWFSKQEFGRVSGFMVACGNLGNLAGTAPLAVAVAAVGWRHAFLAVGVLQALVTLLVFTVVTDRPPLQLVSGEAEPAAEATGMLSAWKEIFSSRDFWLVGMVAFAWYGNYLALQGLWGGPYLMEVLKLSRVDTGRMLMCTSLGFIGGSLMVDVVARKWFRSYPKTLLAGQMFLLLLMTSFLGPAERLAYPALMGLFFLVGVAVSSGVMIYPIVRGMFSVRIVGTALTSLNFYVLMGAASAQQVMGWIVGAYRKQLPNAPGQGFHAAFKFPIGCLAAAIVLYLLAQKREKGSGVAYQVGRGNSKIT